MTASIREIAKNASDAAHVSTLAVQKTEAATATMSRLNQSSEDIGGVVKLITSIAQQTKLLSLNATIEAARAGAAGKGFAVVANEVKELANETAKATEQITSRIQAIQVDTGKAMEALTEISGVIAHMNDISGTIATAVEEQTATTNEIARNVTEVAKGGSQVRQNIETVAQAAKSTFTGARDTQDAAGELAKMAAELQKMVSQFKYHSGSDRSYRKAAESRASSEDFPSKNMLHEAEVLTRS
jgi:methyl-accepting chemotaxis protein